MKDITREGENSGDEEERRGSSLREGEKGLEGKYTLSNNNDKLEFFIFTRQLILLIGKKGSSKVVGRRGNSFRGRGKREDKMKGNTTY